MTNKKRKTFYEETHKREMKTLNELMKRINNGGFTVVNVLVQKNMVGDNYKVSIILHPTEEK